MLRNKYLLQSYKSIPLNEKYKLWNEIITTMPDENLPENGECDIKTLHEYLKKYMEIQDLLCKQFLKKEKNAVYTCSSGVVTDSCGNRLISNPFYWCNIYTALDLCVQDALLKGHRTCDIRKHYIKTKVDDEDYISTWADLTPDGEVKGIGSVFALTEADEKISCFLNHHQPNRIPLPFKKDDTLIYESPDSLWREAVVVRHCDGHRVFVSAAGENEEEVYLLGHCLDADTAN